MESKRGGEGRRKGEGRGKNPLHYKLLATPLLTLAVRISWISCLSSSSYTVVGFKRWSTVLLHDDAMWELFVRSSCVVRSGLSLLSTIDDGQAGTCYTVSVYCTVLAARPSTHTNHARHSTLYTTAASEQTSSLYKPHWSVVSTRIIVNMAQTG